MFTLLLTIFTLFSLCFASPARTFGLLDKRGVDVSICITLAAGTAVDLSTLTTQDILNLGQLGVTNLDLSAIGALSSITLDQNLCLCAVDGTLTPNSVQDVRVYAASDTQVTAIVGSTLTPLVTLAGAENLVLAGVVRFLSNTQAFDGKCPNNPDHSETLCNSCDYNCVTGYERCGGQCVVIGSCPSGVPRIRRRAINVDLECPAGHSVCRVPGRNGLTECTNTQRDVESCGGCAFPLPGKQAGRDCTAIPNVNGVMCAQGQCVVLTCQKGYAVSGGVCVKV